MRSFLALIAGLVVIAAIFTTETDAKTVEFTREYTYQASEADSKLTSRAIAVEQIKRLLLEEIGTFLTSRTEVRDAQLTKDEIVSYTAGSVTTIIITERWNGSEYYVKAQMKADPEQVTEAIIAVKKNDEDAEEMQRLRTKANDSLKEIERLKKEIAELKKDPSRGDGDRVAKAQKEYEQTVAGLSAKEITQQGVKLMREKRYSEAIEQFNKAIEADPKAISPYVLRGNAYIQMTDYDKAIANFNQAIAAMPNEAVAYFQRGRTYFIMKEFDKADADFDTAISKRPNYFPPYGMRGEILIRNKEYEKAIQSFNKAVAAAPRNAEPYFQRGRTYMTMKEYDKALEDFDAALRLRPEHTGAYIMKARVYSQRKEFAQAIAELEKALQLRKDDYGLLCELGNLYYRAKRYEDGVKVLSTAIEQKPSLPLAYMHRSQCYQALKTNDRAMQDLEKAASLGNKGAQLRLDYIKKGGTRKQTASGEETLSEHND